MARDATARGAGRDTKQQIIDAALATLKREGFAGTSARVVAREGGFNSALIFYHFGSLNGLLLAALDHSSRQRMARYQEAVDRAGDLEELVRVALQIYREDVEGGHITVFSELVGASLSRPELRAEIVRRAEPWLDFVQGALDKVLVGTPLEDLFSTRDLAFALIAFYLGVNLFAHLDDDRSRIDRLFETATRLAPVVSPMVQRKS